MRQISLIALSLVVGLGVMSCGDEIPNRQSIGTTTGRIIGGATFTDLPAVGALTYNGSMLCSATLIDKRKVLTAGHCTSGFSASKMKFVIGPTLSSAQYVLSVSKVEPHPQYSSSYYSINNDIGLVHLSQDAPIAPLGVNSSMDSSWVGHNLLFVGYGANNGSSQTGAGIKRAVTMAISQVKSSQFIYQDPSGKNTCNGDSGGPAFTKDANGNYLVAGVTSYGDYGCSQYGADTRVDTYLDFLDVNTPAPAPTPTPTPTPTPDPTPTPTPTPPPDDPCHGETWEGRCDGNTLIYCENAQVKTINCGYFRRCRWNSSQSYYDCL